MMSVVCIKHTHTHTIVFGHLADNKYIFVLCCGVFFFLFLVVAFSFILFGSANDFAAND